MNSSKSGPIVPVKIKLKIIKTKTAVDRIYIMILLCLFAERFFQQFFHFERGCQKSDQYQKFKNIAEPFNP